MVRAAKMGKAYLPQTFSFYNPNGTRGLLEICQMSSPSEHRQTMRGVKVATTSVSVEKGTCITTFGPTITVPLLKGQQSEWHPMLVHASGRGTQRWVIMPAWPMAEFHSAGPFLNHSSKYANVRLVVSHQGVRFIALRRILPGQEVLTRYGRQYARLLNMGHQ